MPLESSVSISPDLDAALRGLKPEALRDSIGTGLLRGTVLITGQIQKKRLSGKGPFPVAQNRLGVVTGRLRGSLRPSVNYTVRGDEVQTSIGTNVKYAAAHEFGFQGEVNVKAGRMKITQVFGRRLAAPLTANRRAFRRRMKIAERMPIRAGIVENMSIIEREIIREVKRGVAS